MAFSIAAQAYDDLFLIYRHGAATYGEGKAESYDATLHETFALLARFPHLAPARTQYTVRPR